MGRVGTEDCSREAGARLCDRLEKGCASAPAVREIRGAGLLVGIELDSTAAATRAVDAALRTGWIVLPEGADARVISLTPPLVISDDLLDAAADALARILCS